MKFSLKAFISLTSGLQFAFSGSWWISPYLLTPLLFPLQYIFTVMSPSFLLSHVDHLPWISFHLSFIFIELWPLVIWAKWIVFLWRVTSCFCFISSVSRNEIFHLGYLQGGGGTYSSDPNLLSSTMPGLWAITEGKAEHGFWCCMRLCASLNCWRISLPA